MSRRVSSTLYATSQIGESLQSYVDLHTTEPSVGTTSRVPKSFFLRERVRVGTTEGMIVGKLHSSPTLYDVKLLDGRIVRDLPAERLTLIAQK